MCNLLPGWLVPPTVTAKPEEPALGSGLDLGMGPATGLDLEMEAVWRRARNRQRRCQLSDVRAVMVVNGRAIDADTTQAPRCTA